MPQQNERGQYTQLVHNKCLAKFHNYDEETLEALKKNLSDEVEKKLI